METPTIGFLGGGRIARILLGGWSRVGVSLPQVLVHEPQDTAWEKLLTGLQPFTPERATPAAAGSQDVVFLAVHPPQFAEVAAQVHGSLAKETIVVSLAPKVTLAKLEQLLGGWTRLARVIPNAPSLVGRGFNPVCFGAALGPAETQRIRGLLEPLGELPEVAEATLEAYAILSAMGPTYFWPQWLQLESLAQEFGLDAASARRALETMNRGALDTLFESDLEPADVLDLIPVKPLADFESTLCEAYRTRLTALMEKIRP